MRDFWVELREALGRGKVPGSMKATISAMGTREAAHHARTILELYSWAVASHSREAENTDILSKEQARAELEKMKEAQHRADLDMLDDYGRNCLREVERQIAASIASEGIGSIAGAQLPTAPDLEESVNTFASAKCQPR